MPGHRFSQGKTGCERAIPARLKQASRWEPGAKGAEGAKDPACRGLPPQSPGWVLSGHARSSRAVTGDVGTTMAPGRESAEGVSRRDSLRRRLGWIWGDAPKDGLSWVTEDSVDGGTEGLGLKMRLVQSVKQDRRVGLTGRGGRAEGKGGRAKDWIDERAEGPSLKGSLGTQGQRISGISPAPKTRPTWFLASAWSYRAGSGGVSRPAGVALQPGTSSRPPSLRQLGNARSSPAAVAPMVRSELPSCRPLGRPVVRPAGPVRVLARLPAPSALSAASHAQCFPARAAAELPPWPRLLRPAPRPFGVVPAERLGCAGTQKTLARGLTGVCKAGAFAHPPSPKGAILCLTPQ